jgi:hypothetical protein
MDPVLKFLFPGSDVVVVGSNGPAPVASPAAATGRLRSGTVRGSSCASSKSCTSSKRTDCRPSHGCVCSQLSMIQKDRHGLFVWIERSWMPWNLSAVTSSRTCRTESLPPRLWHYTSRLSAATRAFGLRKFRPFGRVMAGLWIATEYGLCLAGSYCVQNLDELSHIFNSSQKSSRPKVHIQKLFIMQKPLDARGSQQVSLAYAYEVYNKEYSFRFGSSARNLLKL